MLFSEAHGRKVVSTADASTVGTISSFVVDPAESRIVAVSLAKSTGTGPMLPWGSIVAFGADAVTVADKDHAVEADERLAELDAKQHAIVKKRLLTTTGYDIGTVRDVDFDPVDGKLLSLLLDDREWEGDSLVGIGSYAVIVRG